MVGLNPSWNLSTRMPTRFAARKWPSSCTKTSTPRTIRNARTVVTRLASDFQLYPARGLQRILAGPLVHRANGGERRHLCRNVGVHGLFDDLCNGEKTNAPLEKMRHGHFIRGVEHDRETPVGVERAIRQAQTRKRGCVRHLEIEPARLDDVEIERWKS